MAQVESFFLLLIGGFAAILTVKQMLFHHLFQLSYRIRYPTVRLGQGIEIDMNAFCTLFPHHPEANIPSPQLRHHMLLQHVR